VALDRREPACELAQGYALMLARGTARISDNRAAVFRLQRHRPEPRNTIDLASSAIEQPIAAAASPLVRVGCSKSTTFVSMPASRRSCEVRKAIECMADFTGAGI